MPQPNARYDTVRIFLLVPNLIGYTRLLLLIPALLCLQHQPIAGMVLLLVSGLLDACDGFLARQLNQSSRLGHMLDYTLDRIFAILFAFILSSYYPRLIPLFGFLIILDCASHFFHLTASWLDGKDSHKNTSSSMNWLLRCYYGKRTVLFCACFFHDLFWLLLLVHYFYPVQRWVMALLFLLIPAVVFKVAVHLMQLAQALIDIARFDAMEKIVSPEARLPDVPKE